MENTVTVKIPRWHETPLPNGQRLQRCEMVPTDLRIVGSPKLTNYSLRRGSGIYRRKIAVDPDGNRYALIVMRLPAYPEEFADDRECDWKPLYCLTPEEQRSINKQFLDAGISN